MAGKASASATRLPGYFAVSLPPLFWQVGGAFLFWVSSIPIGALILVLSSPFPRPSWKQSNDGRARRRPPLEH